MADITGTDGDDFLQGTGNADTILGLAGDDWIEGLGGNDTIDAGDGNDVVIVFPGLANVLLGAGNDRLVFSGPDMTLGGGISGITGNWNGGSGIDLLVIPGIASSTVNLDLTNFW
jgi:Ca2+-binding RTX toxin-like protein